MLFHAFPLQLFPFLFPLVAQNYSHSHGIPWESHGNGNSVSLHNIPAAWASDLTKDVADKLLFGPITPMLFNRHKKCDPIRGTWLVMLRIVGIECRFDINISNNIVYIGRLNIDFFRYIDYFCSCGSILYFYTVCIAR